MRIDIFVSMVVVMPTYQVPNPTVTLTVNVYDVNGHLADAPSCPIIQYIIKPDQTYVDGYPSGMRHQSTGVYTKDVKIIGGTLAVGEYIAQISWNQPQTLDPKYLYYVITDEPPILNSYVSIPRPYVT